MISFQIRQLIIELGFLDYFQTSEYPIIIVTNSLLLKKQKIHLSLLSRVALHASTIPTGQNLFSGCLCVFKGVCVCVCARVKVCCVCVCVSVWDVPASVWDPQIFWLPQCIPPSVLPLLCTWMMLVASRCVCGECLWRTALEGFTLISLFFNWSLFDSLLFPPSPCCSSLLFPLPYVCFAFCA